MELIKRERGEDRILKRRDIFGNPINKQSQMEWTVCEGSQQSYGSKRHDQKSIQSFGQGHVHDTLCDECTTTSGIWNPSMFTLLREGYTAV